LTLPAPVYAVKPRGLEPGEVPCDTLVEMAEHAIGVMTTVQPEGPLLLIGYSAGGLVALEAARRLDVAGRDVPLVVLLDTYPSRETWPFGCHVEILVRQAIRALCMLRRLPLREVIDDATRRLRSLLLYLTTSGFKLITMPPLVAEGSDPASRRVHLATYNAGEAYRPLPYSGKVVFIQPEFVPNLEPRKPRRVWGQFLSDLTIRRVPGTHLAMLDECAASAAAEISRCLAEARRW
jgi:thioesterase domain-containing protein